MLTEKEILDKLKQANELILQAKQLMEPAAAQLASMLSVHLSGLHDSFDGELGCYETGFDVICLHQSANADDPDDGRGFMDSSQVQRRTDNFLRYWQSQMNEAGIRDISLQSF